MYAEGPRFTWRGDGCSSKLDRVLTIDEWRMMFPEAKVFHLSKFSHDHCPLLIKTDRGGERKGESRDFRFFAPWVTHDEFNNFVKSSWAMTRSWDENVHCFVENVKEWNKEVFGDLNKKKKRLLRRLDILDRRLGMSRNKREIENEIYGVWRHLEEVLGQEEIMWLQRSRCN